MSTWLFHLLLSSAGLALSALVAAAVLWFWRRHPIASYRLGVLLVVASLALPLAQLAIELSGVSTAGLAGLVQAPVAAPARTEAAVSPTTASLPVAELQPLAAPGELPFLGVLLAVAENLREREAQDAAAAPGALERAAPVLLMLYAVGLALALTRSGRRLGRTRALLRAARPVHDSAVLDAWDDVAAESRLRERTRLAVSDELRVPACFGLFTPTVVLPARDPRSRQPDVLRCVLLHELLHLERRDTWVLLLQEIFRALFWFHPAARWLVRRLETLREVSCDLLVVERAGGRRRYATALVEYAAALGNRPGAAGPGDPVILAWSSSKPQLKRRIEMLLYKTTKRRAGWIPLAAGMFASLWGCQLAMAGTPAPDTKPADAAPHDSAGIYSAPVPTSSSKQEIPLGLHVDRVGVALAAHLDREANDLLLVEKVVAGSPAAHAGLRRFDVLTSVDGHGPASLEALRAARVRLGEGRAVVLGVVRGGAELSLTVGAVFAAPAIDPAAATAADRAADRAALYAAHGEYQKALEYHARQPVNSQEYRDLFELGRDYYHRTDRDTFRKDMQDAMQAYRQAQGQLGFEDADSRYAEILGAVEADPDRYYQAGRDYFNRQSAEDFRDALTSFRSQAGAADPKRTDLALQLRDAERRIAQQADEIADLRAAIEDLKRTRPGTY
jgi:beta-lactamase regulating signal transducer with metallopeptidase domain/tetratricopeptide (TPR) repeat protein